MIRLSAFRLLAAAACLGSSLHAQSESASIRLLAFSRVGEAREVMVAGPDGKPLSEKPLALPTEQLSPALTVSSRSLLFQASAATPTTLGKVDLPASGKDFILVFLPDSKEGAATYKVDPVPVPEGGFGSGDQVFVNYSGSNVGFVIGGEKVPVPQGKSAAYHPKKAEGNRTIVGYAQARDGKWETTPFYSSRLIVQEGVRNLILIIRDPKTGKPDFRGITDFVEKAAGTP